MFKYEDIMTDDRLGPDEFAIEGPQDSKMLLVYQIDLANETSIFQGRLPVRGVSINKPDMAKYDELIDIFYENGDYEEVKRLHKEKMKWKKGG